VRRYRIPLLLAAALLLVVPSVALAWTSGSVTVNAPANLHVNATTSYSASAGAGLLENATGAVFTFPANTDLSNVTPANVTLSQGTPTVTVNNAAHTVTISTNTTFVLGGTWTVTVGNVVNPSVPGSYPCNVTFTSGSGSLNGSRSNSFIANTTAPGVNAITVDDPMENVVSTTTVPVQVGANGRLDYTAQPGGTTTRNTIYVTFPAGYVVPTTPLATSVTVNSVALSVPPTVLGQLVAIQVPNGVTVASNGTATVQFLPSFGMANPTAGTTYQIAATTDAETGTGTSANYTIDPTPTTLTVTSAHQSSSTSVLRGDVVAVDGFTLQRNASSSTVNVSSLTVHNGGTTPTETISGVRIYRDNGDNAWGAGDTLLNSADATFSDASATVTLDAAEAVTTTLEQYWVVYAFAPGAADGATANALISGVANDADTLANDALAGNTFTVDAVAPSAAITSPAGDGALLSGGIPPYIVQGTSGDPVSGVSSVHLKIRRSSDLNWWNGVGWQSGETSVVASTSDSWANWSYAWDFTPSVQDGSVDYTLVAIARDGAGFEGTALRSSIRLDNVPPVMSSASPVDASHVDVHFSEPLEPSTVATSDFAIAGLTITDAALQPDGTTVALTTTVQTPEQSYTASVTDGALTDIAGNGNTAGSAAFSGTGVSLKLSSAGQPIGSYTPTGTIGAVDGFTLEKVAGTGTPGVRSMTIENTGTADDTDVSGVWVYRDANTNGMFDPGDDAALNSAAASLSGGSAVVTLDATETVGAPQQYFVVYQFSATARDGRTANSRIESVATNATVIDNATQRGSTFTVDAASPTTPAVTATGSTSSANLAWNASTDAASGVAYYGIYRGDSSLVATTTATSYRVSGLNPDTTYSYYVTAVDGVGHTARSATVSATTASANASLQTTIHYAAPDGNAGWWLAPPSVTASTSVPAVTMYSFISALGPWSAWTGPIMPYEGTANLYYYSYDASSTETVNYRAFRVDQTPPTTPVMSTSSSATNTADLSWTPSTDSLSGLANYVVYREDGSFVTRTASTEYRVSGLSAGNTYGYYVEAVDVAGNVAPSQPAYVTTIDTATTAVVTKSIHVARTVDTDVCAMCHRTHTAASNVDEVSGRRNALLLGTLTKDDGDVQLCYTCHDGTSLGSNTDVQTEFSQGSGHRMTPSISEYGPVAKQCADCHDTHGTEKRGDGTPYPGLLRARDASGTIHVSGDEYCTTCHLPRSGNEFPGLAVWKQTAHAKIDAPETATDIVCSACHAPHGSPIMPSIRQELTPPSAPATVSVPANDRRFCTACHGPAQRTWPGASVYATSAHGSSVTSIAAEGEWSTLDATSSAFVKQVRDCQTCHAAMGRSDGSGGVIPRLALDKGDTLCFRCHKTGGAASSNLASISHTRSTGVTSLVAAYGATGATRDYGQVHVFSRDSTSSSIVVGPRDFLDGDVGPVAIGDIDGFGRNELLVASANSAHVSVLSATDLGTMAPGLGDGTLLAQPSYLAIGDILGPDARPEVIAADGATVRIYRWNAVSFDPIAAYTVSGPITGMAVGKVLPGLYSQVVVTTHDPAATPQDHLDVLTASGLSLTEAGSYATRAMPTGPSIGDLDGDGLGEIAVANAGESNPTLSIFSGTGTELDRAGSSADASATATVIADVLPGITSPGRTSAEVSLALAQPNGVARVEVFPQVATDLAAPKVHAFAPRTNPETLATGDIDGDGRQELVVGLSGTFARSGGAATSPGIAILHATVDGTDIGLVDSRSGGGVELAGGTSIAIGDIGDVGESRHPMDDGSASHVSTETASAPTHVTCADCHNVHVSSSEPATAPLVPGPERGTWGVAVKNLANGSFQLTDKHSVDFEYELCLKCHALPSSEGRSIATELSTKNASFHPVESRAPETNAVGDTFESTVTAGSLVNCTDCHGNATGSEPAGPHRSSAAPLLVAPVAGANAGNVGTLCFRCHRYDVYATGTADGSSGTSSGFYGRNLDPGQQALHADHTSRGFSCAACHISHGSASLPSLLRGDLGWDGSVNNGGACANSCHTGGARYLYTR